MKYLFIILILISGCGKFQNPFNFKFNLGKQPNIDGLYSNAKIKVNVYYEPGAEPYISDVSLPIKYWEILHQNLAALFQTKISASDIYVPKELADMKKIAAQDKASWTAEEVVALADTLAKDALGSFRIIFLKGFSKEGPQIIGFQITGTNVIAIFKDVIKSTAGGTQPASPYVDRYVEQATLVHEMGHALGLVNNGLPITSAHHDSAHGAHCTAKDCVMYWENEGMSSMMAFAEKAITNLSPIMFDQQCLKDAQSYIPK